MSTPSPQPAALLLLAIALCCTPPCFAQQDEAGFRPLFDGKTLAGWDGDPELWRVEEGVILGATSASNPIAKNQFLIWDGEVGDFVLRVDFRIADTGAGNSGVQYRSKRVPKAGEWIVSGYQADIERTNKYMGIAYEEQGRGILALRGEAVKLTTGPKSFEKQVTGSVGDPDEIVEGVRPGEWQTLEISAIGNKLVHKLNGRTTASVVDEDSERAATRGIVALQLHQGDPMQIEFRNIRLKEIAPAAQ